MHFGELTRVLTRRSLCALALTSNLRVPAAIAGTNLIAPSSAAKAQYVRTASGILYFDSARRSP